MGTSNFYSRNASRIFAFETEDEWSWDDMKSNIESEIESISRKLKLSYLDGGTDSHDLRSFPSTAICRLYESKEYKGFTVGVEITVIMRSGYYGGGNLDWQIQYDFNGSSESESLPEITSLSEDIQHYRECSEGKAAQLAQFVLNWMERKAEQLTDAVEGVFKQFTEPLQVAAQFSNGETIYKRETETYQEAVDRYIDATIEG